MTLETIRHKANESRSKTRRGLAGTIAIALIVVVVSIFGILHGSNAAVRLIFVVAIAWTLAGQALLHRGMWSASMPVDATVSSGFEFYRREIEKRRGLFRGLLQWSFGPVILSIGTIIVVLIGIARGQTLPIRSVMPFGTLFVVWIIAFFVLRARDQRKLRREIDELNTIEKMSRRNQEG
jgi:hypothetical protein